MQNLMEIFYYAYGKPTQKEPYMIYICKTLDEAERRIVAE